MKIKKFKQKHNFNYYTIIWILALLVIVYLYNNWHIDKKLLGIVERKTHLAGARESGRVQNVLITVGELVKKDQVLAVLDLSDLKSSLDQLKNELKKIQELEDDQRDRFSILVQRSALQLENEASDLMDRLSIIEAKSTELAGLNAEIERLEIAEQAGLGHSRDMSDLRLQRDALAAYLREQSKDLNSQTQKLEKTRQSRNFLDGADMDSLTKSMFLDQMQYTESLQRQMIEAEHRINQRTITAPCEGCVTEIFARGGDVIEAYAPVMKVEELRPRFVDIYIPESSRLQPEAGMNVDIYSSRNGNYDTQGKIVFVHPGFTQASERLSFRGQMFWARKARIELPPNHNLIPGEAVTAHINKSGTDNSPSSLAVIASESLRVENKDMPLVKNMVVPEPLASKTRFEPSGIAWLPDIKKHLIVSDDTGLQNSAGDHAPYLFLMDENGVVDSNPAPLTGIKTINDLEAVAPAGNNTFYLVSSQNLSKRNKRPANRQVIIKIKQDGNKFNVQKQINFLSLLLNAYSGEKLKTLGLDRLEIDGKPVLNIEGAAFHDGALYLGLKEPVTDKGAVIWKLDKIDYIFRNHKLLPDQLSVYGYVDLGTFKGKRAGISDLIFDDNGVMWILSTIADAGQDEQQGGLHRINRFIDGRLEAKKIYTYPGLKPEGISLFGPAKFIIVIDNDDMTPAFHYIGRDNL